MSILPKPYTPELDEFRPLQAAIMKHGCHELTNLYHLRRRGWDNQELDQHFATQRSVADNADQKLERIWFCKMKKVLEEVDMQTHCIPRVGGMKFLDLGCCPGGFSSYILAKNRTAKGLGISLDVADGGHRYLLEAYLRPRHDLHYTNLTLYQLGPTRIMREDLKDIPSDIGNRTFDLALLDGHQLRTQQSAMPWDRHRLGISQMILALQAVKKGGTIIVKLSRPEYHYTARILYLLDHLSERLSAYKPRSIHASRGTFYAIAQGIGGRAGMEKFSAILESFQSLWVELTYGGEGSGRFLADEDLDFIISVDDLIKTYLDRLIELGRDAWEVQAEVLAKFLRYKDVI